MLNGLIVNNYQLTNDAINAISPSNISRYLETDLAKGEAQKRISIKGRHLEQELLILKEITEIKNTTDLVKSIVLKINDDVLVNEKPRTINQLKNIMAATV